MPRRHSTPHGADAKPAKPAKPYPDFPLTPHPLGQWCKKIRGKIHYFGRWADPDAALKNYLRQKDQLHSGQTPQADPDAVTVKDAVNAFLNHKKTLLDAGELSAHTFAKYKEATEQLRPLGRRAVVKLASADFAKVRQTMADRWGPNRLADMIQHIRSIFKHAFDAGLIDRPVRFGPGFARPSKKVMRLHRAWQGKKMFTAEEIRRLIDAAGCTFRAMIYLGINCGFGNSDCATLPQKAVNLKDAMIDFARPKTGAARLCPLWPETVAALKDAMEHRPQPKNEADSELFFITHRGGNFQASLKDRPVAQLMAWHLRRLGIQSHKGQGFYSLRRTFRTVADETKDQPAVDFIMGHADQSMAGFYRQDLSLRRLRDVAEHVRRWLFPSAAFLAS